MRQVFCFLKLSRVCELFVLRSQGWYFVSSCKFCLRSHFGNQTVTRVEKWPPMIVLLGAQVTCFVFIFCVRVNNRILKGFFFMFGVPTRPGWPDRVVKLGGIRWISRIYILRDLSTFFFITTDYPSRAYNFKRVGICSRGSIAAVLSWTSCLQRVQQRLLPRLSQIDVF